MKTLIYKNTVTGEVFGFDFPDGQLPEMMGDLEPMSNTDFSAYQASISNFNPRAAMVVSRFQAKAAMLNAGLLAQAEAFFALPDTPPLHKLAWAETVDFYRLSPLVVATGAALNLTDDQLDQLFVAAALIQV